MAGLHAPSIHSGFRPPLEFLPWPIRQPLSAVRLNLWSAQIQLATFAEARITKSLHGMAEPLGDGHEQAIVRLLLELESPAGVEIGIIREFF